MLKNVSKVLFLWFSCVALFHKTKSSFVTDTFERIFWANFNTACTAITEDVEDILTADDIKYLSFIEYQPLGIQRHYFNSKVVVSLLNSSGFLLNRDTVIFIHGFMENPSQFSGRSFATAYSSYGGANVLALDSSKIIGTFYFKSSTMIKYIGTALAYVIEGLMEQGMDIERLHLVGYSLGAHIAGFAGKAFRKLQPGKQFPRITGLDPAGPCFSGSQPWNRLDKNDARFVDVIHTNPGGYGIGSSIGHVDFYPNGGGMYQPGCIESVCSHNRVWKLYEESVVKKTSFIAVECNSWDAFIAGKCHYNDRSVMGYATRNTTRGVYYLRTNPFPPYGLGSVGAKPSLFSRLVN